MTEQQATETPGDDTSTEIPGGDPQEIEPDDSTDQSATEDTGDAKLRREAARYRRSLREAETERDGLRGRVEAMQRAEVERLVADDLSVPADMWLTGTTLLDLLDDKGDVDPAKVTEVSQRVIADRPSWRAAPAPPSFDGGVRASVPTAVALALAKIRTASGSNEPVLGKDATSATGRMILGVPLLVSPFVASNTLWAIDSSRVWLVVRDDATIEADRSVYFTSDRVAVKATMRAAFGFVHPQSVVKVTIA